MPDPTNPSWLIPWIDLETTCLPTYGLIIEAGIVLTEPEHLTVVDSFRSVIKHPDIAPEAIIASMDEEIVRPMHRASGLCEALRKGEGITLDRWASECLAMLETNGIEPGSAPLAGSNVANFDRPWLARHAGQVERYFHYRNIDVSSIKEMTRRWFPDIFRGRPDARNLHRVKPDIEDTILEFRYYLANLSSPVLDP